MRLPRSLLWRLSAAIIAVALLTVSGYLAVLYYSLLGPGAHALDDQLRAAALVVLRSLPSDIDSVERSSERLTSSVETPYGEAPERFQVVATDGRLLLRSPDAPAAVMDPAVQAGVRTVDIDGAPWRVVSIVDDSQRILVQYGLPTADVVADAWYNAGSVGSLLVGIFLLQLIATLWVARRALRPLRVLREALDRREADGSQRIEVAALPLEVQPVVAALNGLLSRVDESREHERQFLADAAHELRTPLTAMRLQVQAVERASEPVERTVLLDELRAGIDRTARLANQMLDLAGLKVRRRSVVERVPCDVDVLIVNALDGLTLAPARGRPPVVTEASGLVAMLDPAAIELAIRNLVHNAFQHGGEAVAVAVKARAEGDTLLIEVRDTGSGIEVATVNAARGSGKVGSGLGLDIVRRACELHGGRLRLGPALGSRGMQPTIELPQAGLTGRPGGLA